MRLLGSVGIRLSKALKSGLQVGVGAGLLAAGMCAVNYIRSRKRQLQNFVSNVDATSSSRQNKDVYHLFRRDEDVASTVLQLPQKACLTVIGKAVFLPILKRQDCRFPVGRRSSIQGLAVLSNFVSRIREVRKPNCKASQPSTPLGLTGAGATGILPVAAGAVVWP